MASRTSLRNITCGTCVNSVYQVSPWGEGPGDEARLVYETSPVVPLFTAAFTVDSLVIIPHLPCANSTRVLPLSPLIPLLMGESNITLK